jgi:DNA invertase Pin-like site-specific DNA recombinase
MAPICLPVYFYARVSTPKQSGDEKLSLEAQLAKMAESIDCKPVQVVQEIGSAYNSKSQFLLDSLIRNMKRNSLLYVYSFDRFSRNLEKAKAWIEVLKKKNCTVCSVTEPNTDVLEAIQKAQEVARQIGEKSQSVAKMRKEWGSHDGVPPYGFIKEAEVVVKGHKRIKIFRLKEVKKQQEVIQFIVHMRRGGVSSMLLNQKFKQIVGEQFGKEAEKEFVELSFYQNDRKTDQLASVFDESFQPLSFSNIAEILNDYDIPYLNSKKWSAKTVKQVILRSAKNENKNVGVPDVDYLNDLVESSVKIHDEKTDEKKCDEKKAEANQTNANNASADTAKVNESDANEANTSNNETVEEDDLVMVHLETESKKRKRNR